jgi:hypothetical protein
MSSSDGTPFQDISTSGTTGASLLASVELDMVIEVVVLCSICTASGLSWVSETGLGSVIVSDGDTALEEGNSL